MSIEEKLRELIQNNRYYGPFKNKFDDNFAKKTNKLLDQIASTLDNHNNGWLPISEAPKDGIQFLACDATSYKENSSRLVSVRWRTYHPDANGIDGFRDQNGSRCGSLTHWQPLPSPPKDKP